MQRSSINSRHICECGYQAVVKISHTERNPGRKLWGCRNYGNEPFCEYFVWVDQSSSRSADSTFSWLVELQHHNTTLQNINNQLNIDVFRLERRELELLTTLGEEKKKTEEWKKKYKRIQRSIINRFETEGEYLTLWTGSIPWKVKCSFSYDLLGMFALASRGGSSAVLALEGGGGAPVISKKGRGVLQGGQPPRCQVEGCKLDLSDVKAYYSRHKVCGMHSKTPRVIVNGLEQRFCQQCSRFHLLTEFDQGKRSCRRRLAGHNERRRKSQPGSLFTSRLCRGRDDWPIVKTGNQADGNQPTPTGKLLPHQWRGDPENPPAIVYSRSSVHIAQGQDGIGTIFSILEYLHGNEVGGVREMPHDFWSGVSQSMNHFSGELEIAQRVISDAELGNSGGYGSSTRRYSSGLLKALGSLSGYISPILRVASSMH
ncbi:hypothetical protein IFM89_039766 [Coptis chinensis]|uniref:Uncharacterized protein n=1 Tax=Coptis chinensis TaxID=261450 RepID=A0A835GXG2_9MAGN|nr:hypothetical protein IFM89_039766 [Coptis chinensis]